MDRICFRGGCLLKHCFDRAIELLNARIFDNCKRAAWTRRKTCCRRSFSGVQLEMEASRAARTRHGNSGEIRRVAYRVALAGYSQKPLCVR